MSEWYSFNDQMHEMFGGKVYRLSVSSGCTCPNRDGTLSKGGCIFCSAGGSGDFVPDPGADIAWQIKAAKDLVQNKTGGGTGFAGYMAYFQSFTNTYGDSGRLAELFNRAAGLPGIVALSVATRPDCLEDDMIRELAAINSRKPVFVELGLQTVNEQTAEYINRCYSLPVFEDAFFRLKAAGIRVVVHVIIGLPGEDAEKSRETVLYLAKLKYPGASAGGHIDGLKLQLLYILRNTGLSNLLPGDLKTVTDPGRRPHGYITLKDGAYLPSYTLNEYAALIHELILLLPGDIPLHRVTGDPPKRDLIFPEWTGDKKRVLNTVRAQFK